MPSVQIPGPLVLRADKRKELVAQMDRIPPLELNEANAIVKGDIRDLPSASKRISCSLGL